MSSTSTNSRFQGPCCGCGVPAPLRSSNQDPNRGRRFFGCINYKQPTACGFFLWLDPERDMEKELIQAENQVLKREQQQATAAASNNSDSQQQRATTAASNSSSEQQQQRATASNNSSEHNSSDQQQLMGFSLTNSDINPPTNASPTLIRRRFKYTNIIEATNDTACQSPRLGAL
ncbi:hypothetical protein Vadar_023465 [Vaccinium darrowii]|uniref:Uncharacterized protein n=1 Tax=Vaccinium darrowii TaxID=229202 RepID=A0ACB7XKN8_9ERIC|nr:hypothetical protein Vadar_023465 [Vaccinium darrowii]